MQIWHVKRDREGYSGLYGVQIQTASDDKIGNSQYRLRNNETAIFSANMRTSILYGYYIMHNKRFRPMIYVVGASSTIIYAATMLGSRCGWVHELRLPNLLFWYYKSWNWSNQYYIIDLVLAKAKNTSERTKSWLLGHIRIYLFSSIVSSELRPGLNDFF